VTNVLIWIFFSSKYWKFDNEPQEGKPLGELVEGPILAKNKFPGIHFPGGTSYYELYFIIIYRNKWSRWKSNSDDRVNQLMTTEISEDFIIELEEDPDGDGGTIVLVETSQTKRMKIDANAVCFIRITNGKCLWSEKCFSQSDHNTENPVFGAIKSRFNNWFIFDKNGKFCKRAQKEQMNGSSNIIAYEYP